MVNGTGFADADQPHRVQYKKPVRAYGARRLATSAPGRPARATKPPFSGGVRPRGVAGVAGYDLGGGGVRLANRGAWLADVLTGRGRGIFGRPTRDSPR